MDQLLRDIRNIIGEYLQYDEIMEKMEYLQCDILNSPFIDVIDMIYYTHFEGSFYEKGGLLKYNKLYQKINKYPNSDYLIINRDYNNDIDRELYKDEDLYDDLLEIDNHIQTKLNQISSHDLGYLIVTFPTRYIDVGENMLGDDIYYKEHKYNDFFLDLQENIEGFGGYGCGELETIDFSKVYKIKYYKEDSLKGFILFMTAYPKMQNMLFKDCTDIAHYLNNNFVYIGNQINFGLYIHPDSESDNDDESGSEEAADRAWESLANDQRRISIEEQEEEYFREYTEIDSDDL